MKKIILILGTVGIFSSVFAADAQTLLEQNGCMSCHNVMGKKTAPAFMGVARRNLRRSSYETAKANIENSIKNGSKGKYRYFTDTQMPPFSNLSSDDLDTLATYILSLKSNRGNGMGRGKGMGGGGGRGMM